MATCRLNIYIYIYEPCKQLADFPPAPVSPVIYTSVSLPDGALNPVVLVMEIVCLQCVFLICEL